MTEAARAKLSAARTGVPNLKARKPPIRKPCLFCQQLFTVRPGKAAEEIHKFCNTACWYEYIRQNPEKNPNWRDGDADPYGRDWKAQSAAARARDGHACQECGTQRGRRALDVHHIIPRRYFRGNYEAANHLDNLVSLCQTCHVKRERALTDDMRAPKEAIIISFGGASHLLHIPAAVAAQLA